MLCAYIYYTPLQYICSSVFHVCVCVVFAVSLFHLPVCSYGGSCVTSNVIYNHNHCVQLWFKTAVEQLLCQYSGLPSERINLSPFTKDFRGGGHFMSLI